MKKFIMLLLAFCLMAPVAQAELSKKDLKECEKLAKKRAKELKKQGYTVLGSLPLESVLDRHYQKIYDGTMQEQQGISTKTRSKNNGRMLAQSNAMNTYAGDQASQLKGRVIIDSKATDDVEWEKFFAAFERIVEKEIRGDLVESYSLIKENPDGTFEIQTMYVYDRQKAERANKRALEQAIDESKLAADDASLISKFINNGSSEK